MPKAFQFSCCIFIYTLLLLFLCQKKLGDKSLSTGSHGMKLLLYVTGSARVNLIFKKPENGN